MARHPRRALLLAAAGLLVVLGIASPASAAPHKPTGSSTSWDIRVPAHADANGKVVPATTVHCTATFAPEPQYSSSGGTYGTIHYGGHITCNATGELYIHQNLYMITGTGDNEKSTLEGYQTWSGVGSSGGKSWYFACLSKQSTRWQSDQFSSFDDVWTTPNPMWSSVYTLTCE